MNRKPPGTRLPAAERRSATVQAVLDLAAAENPADITTSAIAEQMQITQGALFRHFASKDAIWKAVIEQGTVGGEIDPAMDAKAAATLFVGMIQGLVVQSLVSGNMAITRTKARKVFALYRRAVRRAP